MKWLVKTSHRQFRVEAERRIDAEKIVWKQAYKGEEILFIIREDLIDLNFLPFD